MYRFSAVLLVVFIILLISCSDKNKPTEPDLPKADGAAIENLVNSDSTFNSITVSWTSIGLFDKYELRYSTDYYEVIDWYPAHMCDSLPKPAQFGERQYFTIEGLTELTRYYIGIRAIDLHSDTTELKAVLKAYTEPMFEFNKNYYYEHQLSPRSILTIDINNDGIKDVLVSDIIEHCIVIYYGDGLGGFVSEYQAATPPVPIRMYELNYNNDGFVDVAISHNGNNYISVLVNNGTGYDSALAFNDSIINAYDICTGDFNQDFYDDVAYVSPDSNKLFILFNNQGNGFLSPIEYETAQQPNFVLSEDFNNDSYPDIAVSNRLSFSVGIYMNNGDNTFTFAGFYGARMFPSALCSGDFDKNGYMDIGIAVPPHAAILYNEGNGVFGQVCSTFTYIGHHESIYATDLNNDDWLDFILCDNEEKELTIIYNYGNRNYSLPVYHTQGTFGYTVNASAYDYDYDGDNDIFLISYGGRVFSIFNNEMISDGE